MNAVILAAGKGRRLEHLGDGRPKCLLSINGKTALNRLIDSIHQSGVVDNIVVVGGYCIDQVKSCAPSFVKVLENERYADSNSIISLDVALSFLPTGDLVFFNSDIVYEENLLVRYLRHPGKTACLVDETAVYDPEEFFVRMHDARVAEIGRALSSDRVHGRDAQAYRVEGSLVPRIRGLIQDIVSKRGPGEYAGQVMLPLLSNTRVQPVFTNGDFWGEFDTPEEYAEVNRKVSLAERSGQTVESYGLSPTSKTVSRKPAGESPRRKVKSFLGAALGRLRNVLRERRLPSKLDRPLDIARGLTVSPGKALRYGWPLLTRRLSRKGFLLQLHGVELLQALMEEAVSLQITPFLVWGTLLGCTRERSFIFKDEDVDVGLSDEDFTKVEELKSRMALRGYAVRRQDGDKISFLHPTATGLHIDVDRFYKDDSCLWIQTESSDDEYIYSNFFPLNIFDDLQRLSFCGIEVYAPANPDNFLRSVYGAWEIPEEKRDIRRGPLNLYLRKKHPAATHGA